MADSMPKEQTIARSNFYYFVGPKQVSLAAWVELEPILAFLWSFRDVFGITVIYIFHGNGIQLKTGHLACWAPFGSSKTFGGPKGPLWPTQSP